MRFQPVPGLRFSRRAYTDAADGDMRHRWLRLPNNNRSSPLTAVMSESGLARVRHGAAELSLALFILTF